MRGCGEGGGGTMEAGGRELRATTDKHREEQEEREGTRREISRQPEVSGTAPVSPV